MANGAKLEVHALKKDPCEEVLREDAAMQGLQWNFNREL